ncbi:MAG: universal stress protein [Hyphomonadaceae bacterium]|nr:universal stress protein [Hyphomonadaceae bacterium]
MMFKHLLVPAFSLQEDEGALRVAAGLAERFAAEATALVIDIPPGSEYAADEASLSDVLNQLARGEDEERKRIAAWLQDAGIAFKLSHLSAYAALTDRKAAAHAQLADLLIMTRATATRRAHRLLLEGLLFHSGRPLLLAPRDWGRKPLGESIVIGWKPRREAVRALNDAMPFLQSARKVVVVTVNAVGHGEDLAAQLARHDVAASVRNIDAGLRTEGRALLDEAAAIGADMIVMGAYGRSRAEETLFGGVTRELLAHAPVPLFLSH